MTTSTREPTTRAWIHDVRMAQFVLKIEKLSHIMGPRESQDLRSPSPIMAPVIMYSRTSPHQDVNHARQSMFSQGTRSIESIPPTQAAFEQHVKRAAFQAGQVWGRTLHPMQELPSATDWGWNLSSDGWIPTWSTLPEASKACNELIKCGCKNACRGLCKCTKANLPCTALCSCNGNCYQE